MLAEPDADEDVGYKDDRRAPERTCAATRVQRPVAELIRFVASPDGQVVPDLKRRLPGRGVWVTATREAVAEAVKRKAFGRGFKAQVKGEAELPSLVEDLLSRAALDMLSLANKAGRVVTGFAKVETALARHEAAALIDAADASPDGVRKVDQAARRAGHALPAVRLFEGMRLDLALGRSNVVHAALLAGPVSDAFLQRVEELARYTGVPIAVAGGDDETGRPAGTDWE